MKYLLHIFYISMIFLIACGGKEEIVQTPETPDNPQTETRTKQIIIYYTNDEHGWMEAQNDYSGAAGMVENWTTNHTYNDSDSILVLSGGDMWTGPAISTWYKGKSMVDVMNEMGYDACALGNHEFDFTVDNIIQRAEQMNFPFLCANIEEKATGQIPSFAQPYIVKSCNGIKVGIIGLALESTPNVTMPINVEDYRFTPYSDAINKYAPMAQADGAEILIVIGHMGESHMAGLASTAAIYDVVLIGGGHAHQIVNRKQNDIQLIQAKSGLRNFAKVVIEYNPNSKASSIKLAQVYSNNLAGANAEVESIIDKWSDSIAQDLSEVIGYSDTGVSGGSNAMKNMVCDSWLAELPQGDVSITNAGGIRQSIAPGEITIEDIVGVLPFDNQLIELELTGAQILDCLGNNIVGGMTTKNGDFLANGDPLLSQEPYIVITTDYLYYQSNSKFALYDDTPIYTGVGYHQPTVNWIRSKGTTQSNPINNYLDYKARR